MSRADGPAMQRRGLLVAAVLAVGGPVATLACARTVPQELNGHWPAAQLLGTGRLRFLGLRVYEARLWAPSPLPADDWASRDFALEIEYARQLGGAQIAERSLAEMRRQGPLDAPRAERWLVTMKATFPDVQEGDRLTGLHRPGEAARFFHNARAVGQWPDAELTRRFFAIWLGRETSEPGLREALFGGAAGGPR